MHPVNSEPAGDTIVFPFDHTHSVAQQQEKGEKKKQFSKMESVPSNTKIDSNIKRPPLEKKSIIPVEETLLFSVPSFTKPAVFSVTVTVLCL